MSDPNQSTQPVATSALNPFPDRWQSITPAITSDVYTRQHWPLRFSNLEVHCDTAKGDALFFEEVNVILAVIDEIFTKVSSEEPAHGTFIMDGHKIGRECECLLRFNLKDGPASSDQLCIGDGLSNSDQLAAASIDQALGYPDQSSVFAYQYHGDDDGYMRNGVHGNGGQTGAYHVMVLNTTVGRFLVSFYADFNVICFRYVNMVFAAIAEALAQMGKEDSVLQESAREIIEQLTPSNNPDLYCQKAVYLVRHLFSDFEHPVLQAWKAWHEPANNSGELALFFA